MVKTTRLLVGGWSQVGLPASSKRVVDSHLGMLLPPDELAKYTQQAVRGRSGRVHPTVHAVPTCTPLCTQFLRARYQQVRARSGRTRFWREKEQRRCALQRSGLSLNRQQLGRCSRLLNNALQLSVSSARCIRSGDWWRGLQ